MYVFPAGSGCTGNPRLVHPGDEFIFSNTEEDSQKVNGEVLDCNEVAPSCSTEKMEFSHSSTNSGRSFHEPLKQEELQSLGYNNFAPDTMKKVRWVTKMYREWRNHWNSIGGGEQISCDLDCKETISEESLTYALCRFITEVKKLMEVNIQLKLFMT